MFGLTVSFYPLSIYVVFILIDQCIPFSRNIPRYEDDSSKLWIVCFCRKPLKKEKIYAMLKKKNVSVWGQMNIIESKRTTFTVTKAMTPIKINAWQGSCRHKDSLFWLKCIQITREIMVDETAESGVCFKFTTKYQLLYQILTWCISWNHTFVPRLSYYFLFSFTLIYNLFALFFVGVLMWEVFTCGKMPYGRLKNTEVVERVQRGIILEKPKNCFKEVYEVYICSSLKWCKKI